MAGRAPAREPVDGGPIRASAVIDTGDPNLPTTLDGVDTRYKHFALGKSCRRVSRRIALTHRGLTSAGVVRAGNKRSPTVYCSATAHVRIHFKLSFDSAGKPVNATIGSGPSRRH